MRRGQFPRLSFCRHGAVRGLRAAAAESHCATLDRARRHVRRRPLRVHRRGSRCPARNSATRVPQLRRPATGRRYGLGPVRRGRAGRVQYGKPARPSFGHRHGGRHVVDGDASEPVYDGSQLRPSGKRRVDCACGAAPVEAASPPAPSPQGPATRGLALAAAARTRGRHQACGFRITTAWSTARIISRVGADIKRVPDDLGVTANVEVAFGCSLSNANDRSQTLGVRRSVDPIPRRIVTCWIWARSAGERGVW